MEFAGKNVINHRLGGAGTRWRLFGTTAVWQLRVLDCSEFFDWQEDSTRTVTT